MINEHFDPTQPYFAVNYVRMSDPRQNPLSPDQQDAQIKAAVQKCGHPWTIVKTFRDDGISGQLVHSRPGFQDMLQFVNDPANNINLVLVDHYERFGRAKEMEPLRQRLQNRGIFVLTAETNFADPTTTIGELQMIFNSFRAREANVIKSRDVKRGKRGQVLLKNWPGGPPPLGYKLETVFSETNGRHRPQCVKLVPDPATSGIVQKMFRLADETGLGYTRLARLLNADPEFPEELKPVNRTTLGRYYKNQIYIGSLRHNQQTRGIIEDRRVCRKNPESEILTVEDYCEPLISRDLFERVNALREARLNSVTPKFRKQKNTSPGLARGLSVKYLLTGLVYCAHCRCAMHVESHPYVTKNGDQRCYAVFRCPRAYSGGCDNRAYPRMNWLIEQVVQRLLLEHLGLSDGHAQLQSKIADMLQLVSEKMKQLHQNAPKVDIASLQIQLNDLQKQEDGWMQSLADPALPQPMRQRINASLETLYTEKQSLQDQLEKQHSAIDAEQFLQLDDEQIHKKLQQLPEILSAGNVTRANVELALHIDKITVASDGTIEVRIFKLGFLGHNLVGLQELKYEVELGTEELAACNAKPARPRRKTLRDIDDLQSFDNMLEKNLFSQDPHRFDGYPENFFWVHSLQMEKKIAWSDEHAEEVYLAYQEQRNKKALARKFGKSHPTIARAIKVYEERQKSLPKIA